MILISTTAGRDLHYGNGRSYTETHSWRPQAARLFLARLRKTFEWIAFDSNRL